MTEGSEGGSGLDSSGEALPFEALLRKFLPGLAEAALGHAAEQAAEEGEEREEGCPESPSLASDDSHPEGSSQLGGAAEAEAEAAVAEAVRLAPLLLRLGTRLHLEAGFSLQMLLREVCRPVSPSLPPQAQLEDARAARAARRRRNDPSQACGSGGGSGGGGSLGGGGGGGGKSVQDYIAAASRRHWCAWAGPSASKGAQDAGVAPFAADSRASHTSVVTSVVTDVSRRGVEVSVASDILRAIIPPAEWFGPPPPPPGVAATALAAPPPRVWPRIGEEVAVRLLGTFASPALATGETAQLGAPAAGRLLAAPLFGGEAAGGGSLAAAVAGAAGGEGEGGGVWGRVHKLTHRRATLLTLGDAPRLASLRAANVRLDGGLADAPRRPDLSQLLAVGDLVHVAALDGAAGDGEALEVTASLAPSAEVRRAGGGRSDPAGGGQKRPWESDSEGGESDVEADAGGGMADGFGNKRHRADE